MAVLYVGFLSVSDCQSVTRQCPLELTEPTIKATTAARYELYSFYRAKDLG